MANTTTGNRTHVNITVASSSTEILPANAGRRYALVVNDSDEAMYLGIGVAAVMNKGVRLNANGGSFEMFPTANNLNGDAIYGICTSGSKVACGLEMS